MLELRTGRSVVAAMAEATSSASLMIASVAIRYKLT